MTQTECLYMPVEAARALTTGDFGKLDALVTAEEPTVAFELLDTFDQSLARSGRLLFAVGDRFALAGAAEGIVSQPLRHDARFLVDFEDGPVKAGLGGLSPLRSLVRLGSGEMDHVRLAFVDGERKTRVRANLLFLTSGDGGACALAVLRGLRGYDKAFAQLREHILTAGGAPLTTGGFYDLLLPTQTPYDPKPEIPIRPDETAFDAATDIIAACIAVARANEPGIVADHDTEFLHDYRVALRKVRSVLSLLRGVYGDKRTADLKARFSELMAPTGRLRDLDVYLLEKRRFYDLLPRRLHGGLDQLFAMFAEERAGECAKLGRLLESKDYRERIEALAKLFAKPKRLKRGPNADRPALAFASALIWKRYRKVCATAEAIGPESEDEDVHRLRIHCKKLRYLMEFFGPLYPEKQFRALLRPLKKLQDNLGLFNDYSVQQHSLQELLDGLAEAPGRGTLDIAQSVGALIVVLHRRQIEERARVVETFAGFNSPATQKTFRALFHHERDRR